MSRLLYSNPFIRSLAWRVGRKLYHQARGEQANDPENNGEYWFLDRFLDTAESGAVLLDIGANRGAYSLHALRHPLADRLRAVHAFEPDSGTRQLLIEGLNGREQVHVHSEALAASRGEADFYSSGPGAGTNSLSSSSGLLVERVPVTTLDEVLDRYAVGELVMVKVDTEGFDFNVISGGEDALKNGRVEALQFEYNWRWLQNHVCLKDVFGFIQDKPYHLGKLVGCSIEFFEDWHFELDRFVEANLVLVKKTSKLVRLGKVCRFDAYNTAVCSLR